MFHTSKFSVMQGTYPSAAEALRAELAAIARDAMLTEKERGNVADVLRGYEADEIPFASAHRTRWQMRKVLAKRYREA